VGPRVHRRSIVVEGLRLSFLEAGVADASSPSVVMLHGLIATAAIFVPLMEQMAGQHVIALDVPGSGYSEGREDRDASLAAKARIVAKFVEQLGLDRPIVLGHSHGGAIGLELAARSSGTVRSLVLISPAHPFSLQADGLIRLYLSPPGRMLAHTLGWYPRWVQLAGFRRMAGPGSWTEPEQLEPYRENLRTRGTVGHLLRILGTWQQDMKGLAARLAEPLQVPTLMVWGDRDRAVPVETAATLQVHLANAELIVLARVGHRPAEEVPETCARLVVEWMERIGVRQG
jgi:pimeloyl-ACP methyl ester carboxylesterase